MPDKVTAIFSKHTKNLSLFSNYDDFVCKVQTSVDNFCECSDGCPIPGQQTAEDEVVAILLSAMMGSIVDKWTHKPPPEKDGDTHHSFISKPSQVHADTWRHRDASNSNDAEKRSGLEKEEHISSSSQMILRKSTISNSRTKTVVSLKLPSVEPGIINSVSDDSTVLSEDKTDTIPREESTSDRSATASSRGDGTEENTSTAYLQQLKELLVYDKEKIYGWEFLESDKIVIITFKQGNRYEGKLLNCRMHGKGKFYWADGSVYEGCFLHGEITGQGKLQWSDGSWYEGEFYGGYRHGLGLNVQFPSFYVGYWKCGRRHGLGAMYYNHFNTQKDYYNGEWSDDRKHGTGLRSYPSGGMYSGQWLSGKKHGLGTMVWTNYDVYSGNWKSGRLDGYGEYTWETFFNQQLVVPEENCYYGNWVKNARDGNGTLETNSGIVVRGNWKKGKKHGPAEVVCSNGQFLYSDNLFVDDCLCLVPDSSVEVDSLMNASGQSLYRLPVNAASHDINLSYYIYRLIDYANECEALGKSFDVFNETESGTKHPFYSSYSSYQFENKYEFHKEETHLRNVLMQFLSSLKAIYTTYAQMCCDVKPNFSTILMRLMWWQLLRDCSLHARGVSLAEFDICIANNKACLVQGVHYPFERFQFWQFLHCVIETSWEIYGKNSMGTPSVKGILAAGLHKLIYSDLIPNAGRHKGSALLRCKNLLNLDSLYWHYRGVGEPHSARKLLKETALPKENDVSKEKTKEYPEYLIRGRNVIGVGGKLTYLPEEEPLLADKQDFRDRDYPKNLSSLSSLGIKTILECILTVCPSISHCKLIVNMDYKLVFLEFYEILLLCARLKVKSEILKRNNKKEEENLKILSKNNILEDKVTEQLDEVLQQPENISKRKKSATSKKSKKKK